MRLQPAKWSALWLALAGWCLLLADRQQVASADASLMSAAAAAAPEVARSPQPSGAPTTPATQPAAKTNHRLVSKLKDARHRRRNRRNRHNSHRLSKQQLAGVSAADKTPLVVGLGEAKQPQQQVHSPTLVALESIVEEVARAGLQQQQPVSGKHLSSGALVPAEVLLDGSSSPVTRLQQAPGGREQLSPVQPAQSPAQQQPAQPAQPQPQAPAPNPLVTRATAHNSRGFFLTSMLSKIMNVLNVTEFALEMRDGISSRASCMACNAVVGLFLSPLYSKEVFSAAIRTVCTSFKIQSPRVCAGLAEAFQDDFEYIRKNTKLTRDEVCGVVFGVDCARRPTYNLFWTVPIPDLAAPTPARPDQLGAIPLGEHAPLDVEDAPDMFEYRKSAGPGPAPARDEKAAAAGGPEAKALERPQYILAEEQRAGQPAAKEKISTFVQITDIHIDPYYETGALNDCNEPLCCRATSGPVAPNDRRRRAGQWGDYGNCDVPVRTLRNALERIRAQHSDAEYWLWTGDIAPHDIWNISKSETTSHVRLVSKMVREYSSGVPVFPVIGNHEAHPVNSFAPPEIKGKFSMSWLYDVMADEWSDWLPADALRTLRIGGFYKLQLRKGFRIIALNTNYCARLNPWSFFDPVDPANQLKWLADELLEAELNRDKVHIIGHVPPDNRECTQAWLFNFINIVDRFKDTILAQFYGHTHRDEWRIIYSLQPNRQDEPIGIQYIGPSITPFTENNPAYRIYHQDRQGNVLDSDTYYFNLTEANATPTSVPQWRFSYSTRAHLNMSSGLAPADWHHFLQRMHDDDELFDKFHGNFYRFSEPKANQVCRAKCKYSMLSDLRLSHPYKTKPKPFFPNRKISNHHARDRHERDHHHHHKRLRHSE